MKKTDTTKRVQEKHERQNYPSDRKRYAEHEKELNMCIVGVLESTGFSGIF